MTFKKYETSSKFQSVYHIAILLTGSTLLLVDWDVNYGALRGKYKRWLGFVAFQVMFARCLLSVNVLRRLPDKNKT